MLSRFALMVQVAVLVGQFLDHFSPFNDDCVAPEVGMALGSWLGGYIFDLTGGYRLAFLIGVAFNLGNLAITVSLIVQTRSRRLS